MERILVGTDLSGRGQRSGTHGRPPPPGWRRRSGTSSLDVHMRSPRDNVRLTWSQRRPYVRTDQQGPSMPRSASAGRFTTGDSGCSQEGEDRGEKGSLRGALGRRLAAGGDTGDEEAGDRRHDRQSSGAPVPTGQLVVARRHHRHRGPQHERGNARSAVADVGGGDIGVDPRLRTSRIAHPHNPGREGRDGAGSHQPSQCRSRCRDDGLCSGECHETRDHDRRGSLSPRCQPAHVMFAVRVEGLASRCNDGCRCEAERSPEASGALPHAAQHCRVRGRGRRGARAPPTWMPLTPVTTGVPEGLRRRQLARRVRDAARDLRSERGAQGGRGHRDRRWPGARRRAHRDRRSIRHTGGRGPDRRT